MPNKLFRNPKGAVIAIALFLALLLAAFATPCRSETLTFEAGRAVIHGETPVMALSVKFTGPSHAEADFVEAHLLDTDYEFSMVLVGANGANPNQIGAQAQIVDGFGKFDLGLGGAYLQNTDQWNGSHLNFSLMMRYRFTEHWSLNYRHWSNAGTKAPNIGRDMLLMGYRF